MTEKHIYELNKWKLLIEEQATSGMCVEAWCKANGYSKSSYYYWLRELRKESLEDAIGNLTTSSTSNSSNALVEIPVHPNNKDLYSTVSPNNSPSAIIKKGNLSIELYSGMDQSLINLIMKVTAYA